MRLISAVSGVQIPASPPSWNINRLEESRRFFYRLKKDTDSMLPGFEKIVEDRIRAAQRKGELDNLPGTGKPLDLEDDRHIPEDLRLAYKILKNADCMPPEIELKKEIKRTEDLLAGMEDTAEKYHTLKKLNFLVMKLNTIRATSVQFEMPQKYVGRVVDRIGNRRQEFSRKGKP